MIRYDYSGKVALITGGTSGIGLAAARAFAKAGAHVALAARGLEAGNQACDELARAGASVLFIATDVCDEESVRSAVARTVQRFGRLDFACNSAGIGGEVAPLEQTSLAAWDQVMATNARGVFLAMRHEIPAMLASGGGAVVNMSSIYGLAGKASYHAYVASKHAVVGMTRSVALEHATRGVRVNAICAGVTRTPAMGQAEAAFPELVQSLVSQHPMARMATEEEIAGTTLWLCSPDAGYVTGAALAVDGGFLAA